MTSPAVTTKSFDELIVEALEAPFSGWDFSLLQGRWITSPLPWDYSERVLAAFSGAGSLLDMGTGGGEFLASLAPLPPDTWATENYPPNMLIARGRLELLGIHLATGVPDDALPFPDDRFDLVINRHELYDAAEVYRVLKSGGRFLTQQVGGTDNIRLNELLQDEVAFEFAWWTPDLAVRQLQAAGFEITQQLEDFPETRVADIGAVVYYLRAVPWQVEGFSVETHHHRLAAIHSMIDRKGALWLRSHRFYLEALKPRNDANNTCVLG